MDNLVISISPLPSLCCVLVHLGCYNKNPIDCGDFNDTLVPHNSGGWEVQNESTDIFPVWWEPASWFIDGCRLTVASCGRRGQEPSGVFLTRALIAFMEPPPSQPHYIPKTPPPHTYIPLHWGLGYNIRIRNYGGKHSIYSNLEIMCIYIFFCSNSSVLFNRFIEV